MRKAFFLILSIFLSLTLSAQKQIAVKSVAVSFCETLRPNQIVPTVTSVAGIRNGIIETELTDNDDIYIFNIGKNEGFVIIDGTDNSVIAFSDNGNIDLSDMPNNFKSVLSHVSKDMHRDRSSSKANAPEQSIVYNDVDTINFPLEVQPLLGEIAWGQQNPYNLYCPVINDTVCPTGCVATAMAQILRYWQWPKTGIGSKTYTCENYGEISTDFSSTNYDWENMCEQYTSANTETQNLAVAELMYHCGVAMEMKYKPKSSSPSGIYYVEDAYKKYFAYSNMRILENNYFSNKRWEYYIKNELSNNRPVEYAGSDTQGNGAHAFVIDGYNENGYYHVNWGWTGSHNCYFRLDALKPIDSNYSSDCWATINTIPDNLLEESTSNEYFPVAETMVSDVSSVILGGKISVTISTLRNAGYDTLIGKVGYGLYKADGTQVSSGYYWDFSNLRRGTKFNVDYRKRSITIPANLEDGTYYIRAVFKPEDSSNDVFLKGIFEQPNYLGVDVKNNTATIYSPQKQNLDLRVDTFFCRGLNLCRNFEAEFTAKLSNPSDKEYHSYIGILLVDENDASHKILLTKRHVTIPAKSSQTFHMTDTIYAESGTYKAYVVYDVDNLPIDCEDYYTIGDGLNADVIQVDKPKLVVTQNFEVENKDNVPKDNIQVHDIHVKNVGAPMKGFVEAGVYDQSIEKWVGVFDKQSTEIANGEEAILSFQSPYMDLENGEYMLFVLYGGFDNKTYCAYSAGNGVLHYARFTLTDATAINDTTYSEQRVDVYTMLGVKIFSRVEAKRLTTILPKGFYIIKDGANSQKIRIEN